MPAFRPIHPMSPKLLLVITDIDRVKKVKDILNDSLLRFMYTVAADGTAKSELLDLLGVGRTDKAIIISMLPSYRVPELMRDVAGGLGVKNPGGGIAFSIPLSGISVALSRLFDEEGLKKLADSMEPEKRDKLLGRLKQLFENGGIESAKERMKSIMESEAEKPGGYTHDLILSVINMGYSDDLMDVAREAGARGGTIIHARRTGPDEAVKFFGISLQAEKEIVAILIEKEKRNEIMKAISHSCGIGSEAAGIVFSVPVDGIAGLS